MRALPVGLKRAQPPPGPARRRRPTPYSGEWARHQLDAILGLCGIRAGQAPTLELELVRDADDTVRKGAEGEGRGDAQDAVPVVERRHARWAGEAEQTRLSDREP